MDALSALNPSSTSWQDAGLVPNSASFADILREASESNASSSIQLVNTPPKPPAPMKVTPDGMGYDGKIQRQMPKRDWTPEQIDIAVRSGQRIGAINKSTGGPATRYVNPDTGKSVVIDNATNQVIQVGKSGDDYGLGSGDAPGAKMRPPPSGSVSELPKGADMPDNGAKPSSITSPPELPNAANAPRTGLLSPQLSGSSSPQITPEALLTPEPTPVVPEVPELLFIPEILGPL